MSEETKYGILLTVTIIIVISLLIGSNGEETETPESPLLVFGQ